MSLSESDKRELQRMKRKLDGISGPGVRHTRDGVYVGQPPGRPGGRRSRAPDDPMVIVALLDDEVQVYNAETGAAVGSPVALGGGLYLAAIVSGTPTFTVTSNLAMPQGMSVDLNVANAGALVVNLQENALNTHNLLLSASQLYHLGWDVGATADVSAASGGVTHTRTLRVVFIRAVALNCG